MDKKRTIAIILLLALSVGAAGTTGFFIGKNGTAFRAFKSKQQVSIWHTDTGWYVRAIFGTPLFNGVPMNQGASIKLSAGDKLDIDEEQFMAEIIK